jgi:hypothetical protein
VAGQRVEIQRPGLASVLGHRLFVRLFMRAGKTRMQRLVIMLIISVLIN